VAKDLNDMILMEKFLM